MISHSCSKVFASSRLLCFIALFLLFSFLGVVISEDDVKCLQGVKKSLSDPDGNLNSWNFSNSTAGFICNFAGVTCWNDRENRIISLQLGGFNLAGHVPHALQFCDSLQTLDLSDNSLSGTIPPQICNWVPYLVALDLSNNDLTGTIPANISNLVYLNTLILDNNKLSGNIPKQLASLNRLKKFTASNNDLSGAVPLFRIGLQLNFSGNKDLCGGQFRKCA